MGKGGKSVAPVADDLEWVFGISYIDENYNNDKVTKYYTTR
jgi:hypothetical protein